jgi:PhzF family phenazine biosynthesis protein
MPAIRQYIADAFVAPGLRGNPAAVCLLEAWLPDKTMLMIAEENRYSETAFVVGSGTRFRLRWFTPRVEVDLCGHATLAAAFVLSRFHGHVASDIVFETKSGDLAVSTRDDLYMIDLPRRTIQSTDVSADILQAAVGARPLELAKAGPAIIAVLPSARDVELAIPRMERIEQIDCDGLIIAAQGGGADFVLRFFGPRLGLGEDPATGSALCGLAPFWSERLGKTELRARQLSPRGAELLCAVGERTVAIGGRVELFSTGDLFLGSS